MWIVVTLLPANIDVEASCQLKAPQTVYNKKTKD